MRSLRYAAGLFLLAPLVAEFLLGNLPITALYTLVVLAPLYGGGAVLIRETVRRRGLGWPSIFVLALAFGVLEEGITTMSLFNPNYANQRLLDYGYVSLLGMGIPWTLFVLGLHTLWSISAPIAVVETLAGERATRPWLGRVGLTVTAILFAFGVLATTAISISMYQFVASPAQLIGSLVAVGVLIWIGLGPIARLALPTFRQSQRAPHPLLVGLAALIATSVFKQLPRSIPAWAYVLFVVVLAGTSVVVVWHWAHQAGWGDAQRLGLAAGALLTYAWSAFPQTPVLPASTTTDLLGNCVFAAGAVILVAFAARRVYQHRAMPPGLAGAHG